MSGQSSMGQELARLSQIIQQQSQAQQALVDQVQRLQGELAAVQGQQAVQQPRVNEPTFAAAKIKLDLPPKFSGKPCELSAWLFSVEQYCNIVGISKPVDMVRLAVSRLERDAFTWWRQLTSRGSEYQLGTLSWSDFEGELVNAFADVDRELRLRRQLSALRQQTSVTQYTKQFRQLVLELGDQAPDDGALLFMFIEGLKADVKLQVLLTRPQLLSEAELIAERADVALFSAGKRPQQQGQQQRPKQQWQPRQQYRFQPPPPPPPRNGPMPMDLGAIQGQQPRAQPAYQQPAARQIVCYRCGKKGHMAKDCRVKLQNPRQQYSNLTWVQAPQEVRTQPQPQVQEQYPQGYSPMPFQALPSYAHMQAPQRFDCQPPPPPPLNE